MNKFIFESKTTEPKAADVSIYKNGMVRFSRQAIETHGIFDTDILWGENEEKTVLAIQKVSSGRALRGKRKDTTSCPIALAQRYMGKYTLKPDEGVLVLVPV